MQRLVDAPVSWFGQAEKLRKQIEEKNRLLAEQRAALKRATEAQEKAAADEVAHKEKSRKLAAGFSAVRPPCRPSARGPSR